jgi:DNA-binding transcriptional MocR family regulator
MSKSQKSFINLLKGWPSPNLAPIAAIRAATEKALADPEVFIPGLNYGPDLGYGPLRESIARWLSSFYDPAQVIGSQRICISGGASQNLARVLQGFTDPRYTRNIWMIAPTYFLACRIFEDAGFSGKLKAVPEDAEGVNIRFLRSAIKKSEDEALAAGNDHPV